MRSILSEYRIANADITLRYDATADDLIDVIEGNRQVSYHNIILYCYFVSILSSRKNNNNYDRPIIMS